MSLTVSIICGAIALDRSIKEVSKDGGELSEVLLVVCQDFEFGLEVEEQEDGACEC